MARHGTILLLGGIFLALFFDPSLKPDRRCPFRRLPAG